MVWFRRDTLIKSANLVSSVAGADRAAHFLFFPTVEGSRSKPVTGHGTAYTRLVGGSGMTAEVWTFVAVTFSTSSGFTLHLNTDDLTWTQGTVVTSAYVEATDALALPIAINIGGFGVQVDATLDGDVAALVVHARALTTTEVREYHAATSRRFYP
jgi:hypothetical protein